MNFIGSRLLTGGDELQMWHLPDDASTLKGPVEFFIEGKSEADPSSADADSLEQVPQWVCLWHCRPSNTVYHLKFSSDGLLFASAGKSDRLVKVWYENKKSECQQILHITTVY